MKAYSGITPLSHVLCPVSLAFSCQMSDVMCHVSCVLCPVSFVLFPMSCVIGLLLASESRWRYRPSVLCRCSTALHGRSNASSCHTASATGTTYLLDTGRYSHHQHFSPIFTLASFLVVWTIQFWDTLPDQDIFGPSYIVSHTQCCGVILDTRLIAALWAA